MLSSDYSAATNVAAFHRPPQPDAGVLEVADWFQSFTDMERLFASSIRQAIDEVLDGQRTGRFDLSNQAERTEKTYLGTKVEIIIRAAFRLPSGTKMDYKVAGHDVDAKFTMGQNWSIPLEATNNICLLMNADDRTSVYRVGLLRINDNYLNPGSNRDKKRGLSKEGRAAIKWLVLNGQLPENILLHLRPEDRDAIFSEPNGQRRTNELFRRVQGRIINRATVLTVARQDDSPKRVRDARIQLRSEGIIILGHQKSHQHIATALRLPAANRGEWVAIRVTPAHEGSSRPSIKIGGTTYEVAQAESPATEGPRVTE